MIRILSTLMLNKLQGGLRRHGQICWKVCTRNKPHLTQLATLSYLTLAFLVTITLLTSASAQITTSGDVAPVYPATQPAHWDLGNEDLWVGDFLDGEVTVASGRRITSNAGHVGIFGNGTVTLTGQNSRWTIASGGLDLGMFAEGRLEINDGAQAIILGDLDAAHDPFASASILVDGADSLLEVDGSIHFITSGLFGNSELVIDNGAEVRLTGGLVLDDPLQLDFRDGLLEVGGTLLGYEDPIDVGSQLVLGRSSAEWRASAPVTVDGTLSGIGVVTDHVTLTATGRLATGLNNDELAPSDDPLAQVGDLRLRNGLLFESGAVFDETAGYWGQIDQTYDRTLVNGTATVEGGTLRITTPEYAPVGETCRFLRTTAGLTVDTELTADAPIRYDVTLGYDTNDYWFKLTHNPDYYSLIATTPNQSDLAEYLEDVADTTAPGTDMALVLNEFNHLPEPLARQALDQMSAQSYASRSSGAVAMTTTVISTIASQLRPTPGGMTGLFGNSATGASATSSSSFSGSGFSGSGQTQGMPADGSVDTNGMVDAYGQPICGCESCRTKACDNSCTNSCTSFFSCKRCFDGGLPESELLNGNFWANTFGQGGQVIGDANSGTLDLSAAGVACGFQQRIDEMNSAGWFYTYSRTFMNTPRLGSSSDIHSHWLGLNQLHVGENNAYLLLTGSLGLSYYATDRRLDFGQIDRIATSHSDGWQGVFYGETGYTSMVARSWLGQCSTQPYFALQYAYVRQNAIDESGAGSLDLAMGGTDTSSFRSILGTQLEWTPFRTDAGCSQGPLLCDHRMPTIQMRAAWTHEYAGQATPDVNAGFAGYGNIASTANGFNSSGVTMGRDWANLGVGARWRLGPRSWLQMDYDTQLNHRTVLHTASGSLVLRPHKFPVLIKISANVGMGGG